jgi:iron complex transport system substrate-binding protein
MKRASDYLIIAYFFIGLLFFPSQAADNTLMAFGNANMDDVIDQADITYVQGIIKGTAESTKLADANYDGKVDEDDITQIEQIMRGEEKQLILIDMEDRIVTVPRQIKRVVSTSLGTTRIRSPCRCQQSNQNPEHDHDGAMGSADPICGIGFGKE